MNKELSEILIGFKRSWQLIEPSQKIQLLLATAVMVLTGLLTNLPAVLLGQFVDTITKSNLFVFSQAIPFILLISGLILVREGLTVIRKYLVHKAATQTEKAVTVKVTQTLLQSDLTFISNQQIGSLHGRVLRSIQGLIRIIRLSFQDFLPIIFSALSAVVLAFYQKPMLASFMILVIPTALFIIFKQISSQKGIRLTLLRGKEKVDGTMVEILGGLETVRVIGTTNLEVSKIAKITEGLKQKEIHHHLMMALFDAWKQLNDAFFYVLVVALAIYLSSQGIISRGDILVYSILFVSVTAPLKEIHRILDHAHEGSILVNDLFELLNKPQDISFAPENVKEDSQEKANNSVVIKNLSFSYPQSKTKVLTNINLSIQKGERIGIAGSSGCGKSTLIKIVLRLVHGYSGEVTLLGENLLNVTRKSIAREVAYISQKPYIFSATIKENILYGANREVSKKELLQASKQANILQEIDQSLGGFEGKVGEGGNNLSGGQKQRLALARLFLQSPELLIFDEATSALDNINEAIIQKNIETQFKDKTIFIIAHRLSTLKNCDRILVFNDGQIVQQGTYQELSAKTGLFQEFLKQTVV